MDILVLGGSYFLGRHFVDMAVKGNNVTVFNRGNRPFMRSEINELCGDRHDGAALAAIANKHFDAVVDFCAYAENDIEYIFKKLNADFEQYIFVSTCDVYERGQNAATDEDAPFEMRQFPGETGAYISGKVALERELVRCAGENSVAYTSIRPAIIYGPGNYAPRENIYFNWIENAGQILHPEDATGEFQMVYVEDVARAILCCVGNEVAYNQAYNLTPLPAVTYESFAEALEKAVDKPFTKISVPVDTVVSRQIPLPFPLIREESNLYNGQKVLKLIGGYTELSEGLRKTWNDK